MANSSRHIPIELLRKMLATRIAAHQVLSVLSQLGADETPVAEGALFAGLLSHRCSQDQFQSLLSGLARLQLIARDQHFATLLDKGKAAVPLLSVEIEGLRARLAGR